MIPRDLHLRHLDLFSGVGMFALAARWAGIETVAFSEINPHANKVLNHQFPTIRNLGDVQKLCRRTADCDYDQETGEAFCPRCEAEFGDCECVGTDQFTDDYGFPDIITAGSPCQGFLTRRQRQRTQRPTQRPHHRTRPDCRRATTAFSTV